MKPVPFKRRGPAGSYKFKQFIGSFRPRNFRRYWLSQQGLRRFGRLAGHGALVVGLLVLFIAKDLPTPGKINARLGAQTTRFYDRKGETILYEVFGNKNRNVIKLDQMPENVQQATIAIEDKNFYKHGAFSVFGIGRAFTGVIFNDPSKGGGSTITQQYVKNALLSPERSFTRKIRELILSIIIEQFYRKDDILALYLNEIPYGTNAYGIQAAAKTYFDKDAKQLNLKEASMLAAIPRAPTFYSPYGAHRENLIARQNKILDLMVEQEYVSKAEAEEAKIKSIKDLATSVRKTPNYFANIVAPHFSLYVQEQLEAKYGSKAVTEGGLKIITTIDLEKQKAAEKALEANIDNVRGGGGSNSALVSSDPKNGQVLAMVGSYDFNDSEFGAFNVATANRQPGSSFKPFAYATAFAGNYGPGTTLYDVTTDFGGNYKPENYTDQTYGVQSMRTALAGSLNIPAVKTLYLAGIDDTIKTAKRMGITTLRGADEYGLSLVLGAGEVKMVEMANAYESFANGGVHHEQTTVLKITDPRGKVIEEYKEKTPDKVIDPQVAFLISNVLSDNGARAYIFGSNNPLVLPGRQAAAKTGTTENYRDAWTVGYTPSLVTVVWSGNNDNKSMSRSASSISAPAWQKYMTEALKDSPKETFVQPEGIKKIALDANTGKLPGPDAKKQRTDLFPSWYKPAEFTESKSAEIDKVSGKLATACTPDLAKQTVHSTEIHAEIPSADPAYSRWEPPVAALAKKLGYKAGGNLPTEKDDVHNCGDAKPQITISAEELGAGSYKITAEVDSGKFVADKLDIYLDDQIISTQAISGDTTYSFNHTITQNGGHQIKGVVTDKGLYQATDTKQIDVSDAGVFSLINPSNNSNQGPGNIGFEWSNLAGASSYIVYYRRNGGAYTSVNSNNNSKNILLVLAGTYNWYVEALSSGNLFATSPTGTFLVP